MRTKIFMVIILLLTSNYVFAVQIKTINDERKVICSIGYEALNRIAVVDDRIAQVFGLEEDFFLETDEKSGQIFIKPKNEKSINLSIITEKHLTIDLQLLVEGKDSETILLKPKFIEKSTTTLVGTEHSNKITKLILGMAKGNNITSFSSIEVNREIALWKDVNIVQTKEYIGKGLRGELYTITNNSKDTICLTETQFGLEKDAAGVAIVKHTLLPGCITAMYIVRHNV